MPAALAHLLTHRRPTMGLARRRAVVLPRHASERHRSRRPAGLLIRMAGSHRRGTGGPHPARQRRRPLAARRHLRIDRPALGLRLPAIRTLDVGRRLARAAGHELRSRTRLSRCRRLGHDPRRRRIDGARDHLDRGPSPRQVFFRRHADGDPRPQRRAGAVRVHDRFRRMAGTQFRRRNALRRRERGPCSADCGEHAARAHRQRRWSRR